MLITIKLMGGAKKSFSTDKILLEKSNLTINELIKHLIQIKPNNTLEFDTKNLLIAVNGVDSSALQSYNTKVNDNDIVSIIPIIHGGSQTRMQFSIMNTDAEIFHMFNDKKFHTEFLNELRSKYPHLNIQAINSRFILGVRHAKKILGKKIETDILLRFAGTTQISHAINIAGRKLNRDFLIIAIGKKSTLNRLHSELKSSISAKSLLKNNNLFLKKQFKISKKQTSAILSKNPLEDIIVERSAIL